MHIVAKLHVLHVIRSILVLRFFLCSGLSKGKSFVNKDKRKDLEKLGAIENRLVRC